MAYVIDPGVLKKSSSRSPPQISFVIWDLLPTENLRVSKLLGTFVVFRPEIERDRQADRQADTVGIWHRVIDDDYGDDGGDHDDQDSKLMVKIMVVVMRSITRMAVVMSMVYFVWRESKRVDKYPTPCVGRGAAACHWRTVALPLSAFAGRRQSSRLNDNFRL